MLFRSAFEELFLPRAFDDVGERVAEQLLLFDIADEVLLLVWTMASVDLARARA